ncbi:unnamed protein product [Peronospora farinosa]|uniref:Uncharacterized protein n=1 Tax=Peronospora farinosa TaxID=134698 RepID=A0ABN8CCW2_9STRA|nr:unnamed protein product [Peronospora farinosa]
MWVFVALWLCSQAFSTLSSLLLMHRISTLRAIVRERFDIPGSIREDRTAAWQETARAIRQMRRHLKIDNAKCGIVNALPAYIV